MKVIKAKTAGFCIGVEKAVKTVYEQVANATDSIYTYGPIIHNEEVVKDLECKGVKVLENKAELQEVTNGCVIIRSHGVGKDIYDIIAAKGLRLVDTTCFFVKKIHNIVSKESAAGAEIVIIGNDNHAEVKGIKGWCKGLVKTISTEEEARRFVSTTDKKICIVSQTTFNYNKFNKLVEIISKKGYDILVLNTICNATSERQMEAEKIAKEVEAMIVIGGQNSSNTQKLFEICQNECENTYYIQTLDNLDVEKLHSIGCVGITAGASTPNNIIEEVLKECQK